MYTWIGRRMGWYMCVVSSIGLQLLRNVPEQGTWTVSVVQRDWLSLGWQSNQISHILIYVGLSGAGERGQVHSPSKGGQGRPTYYSKVIISSSLVIIINYDYYCARVLRRPNTQIHWDWYVGGAGRRISRSEDSLMDSLDHIGFVFRGCAAFKILYFFAILGGWASVSVAWWMGGLVWWVKWMVAWTNEWVCNNCYRGGMRERNDTVVVGQRSLGIWGLLLR